MFIYQSYFLQDVDADPMSNSLPLSGLETDSCSRRATGRANNSNKICVYNSRLIEN